jgi:hypothetical protein
MLNFNRYQIGLNNKFFVSTALSGYKILQYSIRIYVNHNVYLMMALCGRNMFSFT